MANNFLKSKLIKKLSAPKPSGIASGQRAIQKSSKQENPTPVHYHPWNMEYHRIFTREKIKKSMTKDPYTTKIRRVVHARESITTEDECCPALISANIIHIEKPIIHRVTRPPIPGVVRYLRCSELTPSEKSVSRAPTTQSSLSRVQIETKTPITTTKKLSGIAPTLAATDRAKIRNDPFVIRRPPRKLIMYTSYETTMPLTAYG